MKLTLPQQDIYFEQLLYPNEPIYNIGAKIEIKGNIDYEILNNAYNALINQHDAYRSFLLTQNNNVSIEFLEDFQSTLQLVDFSMAIDPIVEANLYMQDLFLIPFDLHKGGLLHLFSLVKIQEDFHYLFSVYHHIITDGWGTSIMFQRLVQNYNELAQFGTISSIYPYSYKDFVEDDSEYEQSDSMKQDINYWTQKFKYLPENLFSKINEKIQGNKSKRKQLIIKREVYNQLNSLALEYKSSTFHLILGLIFTYFGRLHEKNDLAVGLPVLNRGKAIFKKTVGLFMGISPLRISLDFDATFQDLISGIKNQLRQDYRHQRLPLGSLIQHLKLYSNDEKLFNITLSFEKQDYSINFLNTDTKVIPLSHEAERVALALYIREFDDLEDVAIDFDYNINYFDLFTINQTVDHFEKLMIDVLANPNKKLFEFDFLSEKDRNQLLYDFNKTIVPYSNQTTLLDQFKEQVSLDPNQTAVIDSNKNYSYEALDHLSDGIATQLIAKIGSNDKSPIAVLLDRSANMIATLLGILKTGRPYLPLDPSFPAARLSYIINDSQSNVIIYENVHSMTPSANAILISLDSLLTKPLNCEPIKSISIDQQDTAYIIYTSGSTGNPKGVEISHRSLINFLLSIRTKPGINAKETLFSVTTYSFDISILEFFAPLISGATTYVAEKNLLADPFSTIKKLIEINPSIIQATPSFYQMLFNADWKGGRELKILCGGDLLSEMLAEKLIAHSSEVWNMYGPTETTIWSSCKKIEKPTDASNIGKPINNTQIYITDGLLNLKPIGAFGNIYISGDGLAKGYFHNPELTTKKFIPNPFDKNKLCYETGDIGKWNSNGEILFSGRSDNQVKIRGFRIELGEIESLLNQMAEVENSVVISIKNDHQEALLVAYIVPKSDIIDINDILFQLKSKLPVYMIPNVILPISELPLTPNHKIDRKVLSQLYLSQKSDPLVFKEAISDAEKKLVEIWCIALDMDRNLSADENFFALGGHSLNAVKLAGLIAKELNVEIGLKDVFDNPTIESLALHLQRLNPVKAKVIPETEKRDYYQLTPAQYTIWLASQRSYKSIAYNMAAAYMVEGDINIEKVNRSVTCIIEKHEALRTNFVERQGIPFQKIRPAKDCLFEVTSHTIEPHSIEKVIDQFISAEFNLEKDLFLKIHLLEIERNLSILLFLSHHIILDGMSLEIFVKEFIQNYNTHNIDTQNKDTLNLQFKDYSDWLNAAIVERKSHNEIFWSGYLQNFKPQHSFKRDFYPKKDEQNANQLLFELDQDTTLLLKQLALDQKVTLYTILVATINTLISKLSGNTDICIGSINAGRESIEFHNLIGMFAKTIILRTNVENDLSFVQFMQKVQHNILEVNEYQDLPFDSIPGNTFDVLLVFQNPEFSFDNILKLDNLKLSTYPVKLKFSRIPIVFNLKETGMTLMGSVDYNADLFKIQTIDMIVLKLIDTLSAIANNPQILLNEIDKARQQDPNLDFEFNF